MSNAAPTILLPVHPSAPLPSWGEAPVWPPGVQVWQIDFEEASGLLHASGAAGVELLDWPGAFWVGARRDDQGVNGWDGVACIRRVGARGSWWRLAACFVKPQARGKGMGTALTLARLRFAHEHAAATIDTFSYNPALFERLGWCFVRAYPGVALERWKWSSKTT